MIFAIKSWIFANFYKKNIEFFKFLICDFVRFLNILIKSLNEIVEDIAKEQGQKHVFALMSKI